jgi:NADPH:quinone reductase-like Zn-dependent oxidoreductase
MAPSTNKQWTFEGTDGFDSLKYNENASIPEVGDRDVLVKSTLVKSQYHRKILTKPVHASSLNYRDLVIPLGKYPFPMKNNTVPGSDGAGTVESVGKHVTRFKPGGTFYTPTPKHLTK